MSLYGTTSVEEYLKHIEEIEEQAKKKAATMIEPTLERRWEIIYTVRDFVIEKKRKIYGGFALNLLIGMKEPKDKFYKDDDIEKWDIDFYSPDPINDAIEIANRLHKKKFKNVQGTEAQHDETYTVFAEGEKCADISYVPRNIYNKIPFNEYKNMTLTGAYFMMIDYFRVLTDPMTSYFRLTQKKSFERLLLLTKHYPLPKIKNNNVSIIPPPKELDIAFRTINNFLIDRKTTIAVGMYAYNYLIKECKIKTINHCDVNYYEIISTFYKKDVRDLLFMLYDKFPDSKNKITYKEFYPFFQYFGFRTQIYYEDTIICIIYHYNSRCTPYNTVPSLYFTKKSFEENKGNTQIGTFSMIVLYNLINVMIARTNNDDISKDLYYKLLSNMIEMQEYHQTKNNKTIFDEGLFKEFTIECIGTTMSLQSTKQLRIDKRRKAGHMIIWRYQPELAKDKNVSTFYFKNSSGNIINNVKNMKIDLTEILTDSTSEIDESETELVDLKE